MFTRLISFAAVAMLALLVLAACGGGDEEGEEAAQDVATRIPDVPGAPTFEVATEGSPATEAAGAAAGDAAASPAGEAAPAGGEAPPAGGAAAAGGPFEVVSVDIAFEPAALTIPAGQDVVVNIPNSGALPHNFSIDELNISVDQPAGYTGEVTINAPAGTYTYYCNVPGHRAAGMEGTLTVQ